MIVVISVIASPPTNRIIPQAPPAALPDTILRRKTKLGFETPQARWLGAGPVADAVDAFTRGDSPAWAYADRAATRALAADARSGWASREARDTVFRAFLVDRWLRRFELGA